MYACAGYNRFELDRDGPEIPHMARYIAKVDAAYAASRLLPPWDQARAILRAEYAAFMERCPADRVEYRRALRRHLRQCDAMEAAERASGRIRRRRVTDATITKWWFHAAEGKR